jgi:hypothetical protein
VSPSPDFPNLAGQYADYLQTALSHYKNGKRKNAIMQAQVEKLTTKDMMDLAAYFSSQKALQVQALTVTRCTIKARPSAGLCRQQPVNVWGDSGGPLDPPMFPVQPCHAPRDRAWGDQARDLRVTQQPRPEASWGIARLNRQSAWRNA